MSFADVKTINNDDLKFSAPRSTTGKRYIKAYYNKKILSIKLPKLKIPFDTQISQYNNQLETNVSLGDNQEVINKLQELDDKMSTYAIENGWFNSDDFEYVPTLRKSRKGDYPPTFKIKIPKKDGEITTKFYDQEKKHIQIQSDEEVLALLKRGTFVISALECVSVWFIDNKFGLSWKAEQMRVYPANNPEFVFDNVSDDSMSECLIYE